MTVIPWNGSFLAVPWGISRRDFRLPDRNQTNVAISLHSDTSGTALFLLAEETCYNEFEQTGEMIDDTLKALSSDVMVNTVAGVGFLKALNKLKPSLDRLLADLGAIRRAKPTKKKDQQA